MPCVSIPGGVDRPLSRVQLLVIRLVLSDHQVMWRVVRPITIDVMNDSSDREIVPQGTLGHEHVFADVSACGLRVRGLVHKDIPSGV